MNTSADPSGLVDDAQALFEAAVERVQAPHLLSKSPPSTWAPAPLSAYASLHVVGMGKAALAMAGAMGRREAHRSSDEGLEGCVVVPEGYAETCPAGLSPPSSVDVMEGGHPLPTRKSIRAARRMLEHAEAAGPDDLLLVLVSGGGTALSTLPAASLDVTDLRSTYHRMLTAGVPVQSMNAVRKHLTQVGGGQLARAAAPATVAAGVVSDVVGNDMSVIASGATVPDSSTYEDAIQVLYRHNLWHDVPRPVRTHLAEGARGKRPDTPGPGDPCFERAHTDLIGTNRMALDAAADAAEARGYEVRRVKPGVEGEARDLGKDHVDTMLEADPSTPTCWLWGGEPTVTVTGEGKGGRNQEVALSGALALQNASLPVVLLSGGTDGVDGPTDAAGAWATPDTAERARAAGCDPEVHLAANNAYPLFDATEQLLRTGPTHTNVMDVHVGLVHPDASGADNI